MAQAMLSTFFEERCLSDKCHCEEDKGATEKCEICEPETSPVKEEQVLPMSNIITISPSFPRQPTSPTMTEVLEYRIKVLSSSTETFEPGETRRVLTNIDIAKKPGKLSLLLKPAQLQGFIFQDEGYINPAYKGRISVSVQNSNCSNALIPARTVVAYLILISFQV